MQKITSLIFLRLSTSGRGILQSFQLHLNLQINKPPFLEYILKKYLFSVFQLPSRYILIFSEINTKILSQYRKKHPVYCNTTNIKFVYKFLFDRYNRSSCNKSFILLIPMKVVVSLLCDRLNDHS